MGTPCPNRPTNDELRRLYEDERWTSRQIAARFGVDKITILRWLKAEGIEVRPTGRGLAHRGGDIPDAETLHRLVHDEHLSYRAIAKIYDVDFTAVPHWLDLRGVDRPTVWQTRRKGVPAAEPTEQELRQRVASGEPLRAISQDYGVSATVLAIRCRSYGIELLPSSRYGRHTICQDGHPARSSYEAAVDDWLSEHGVSHEVEPQYPFDRRYKADFLVDSTYIEIWGVVNSTRYERRRRYKVRQCQAFGLDLVEIEGSDFNGPRWLRILERFRPQSVSSAISSIA